MAEERFSRNVALFGSEGQEHVGSHRAAVVGVGGLGSHIVQQLVYLGISGFVLVDGDVVTPSSLNRMIGALPIDAERQEAKVRVSERLVTAVRPDAEVTTVGGVIGDPEAQHAVRGCTVVFGCVDNDAARLELTELCSRQAIPLVDAATDVHQEGAIAYGGRVLFSRGQGCPVCTNQLDTRGVARGQMSEAEREVDDQLYGVDRSQLEEVGPSVVSVNGLVASLAVTEFMVWATGLRSPNLMLTYRGEFGGVFSPTDLDTPADCYYCGRYSDRRSC